MVKDSRWVKSGLPIGRAALLLATVAGGCQVQTTLADATGGAAAAAGDDDGSGGTNGGKSSNVGGSSGKSAQGTGGKSASSGGATGGTVGGGSGGGGTGGGDVLVVPDNQGWVDPSTNPLGLQGPWYSYGDQYYAAPCTMAGGHAPSECAVVNSPPPYFGFPNVGGTMCTDGTTMPILPCIAGLTTEGCPDKDYEHMWGAGIGFDFNADRGEEGGARHPWDAAAHGIVGIAFDIDAIPGQKLRIEFPMMLTNEEAEELGHPPGSTTDDDSKGSPYWGATSSFPASPLIVGRNRILWTDITDPLGRFAFDPSRVLSIHFHVPSVYSPPAADYAFCVSNLTFLRDTDIPNGTGGAAGSGGTDSGGSAGADTSPGGDTGAGGSGGNDCSINTLESYCAEFYCPSSLEQAISDFEETEVCSAVGAEVSYYECGYTSLDWNGGFSGAHYEFDTQTGELVGASNFSDSPYGPCDQFSYHAVPVRDQCVELGHCAACTADGAEPPELECRLDCDCSMTEPLPDPCFGPDSCDCYCAHLAASAE